MVTSDTVPEHQKKIGRCHSTVTIRSEMTRGHPSTRRNILLRNFMSTHWRAYLCLRQAAFVGDVDV